MQKKWFIFIILIFMLLSCKLHYADHLLYKESYDNTKTQLQLRELQERTFEGANVDIVLKAVFNVLQDDGYITKNLNPKMGYFNAVKETKRYKRIRAITYPLKDIIEATINVTQFGRKTKIRASFHYTCIQLAFIKAPQREWGSGEIYDAQFYQDFYMKLDKALYLEKEKL